MRILLVEDEVVLAEALTAALKRENYAVDAVYNGTDGLDQALTGIYDILLLDIMLPGLSGLEILREVRRQKIKVRIMMLTARSDVEDKIQGLDFGADDYLTKPFHMGELIARVRALSRRDTIESEDMDGLSFGDLTLDTRLCEVVCKRSGKSMKLGAKEFQLLEYLLRNIGQLLSKEQIATKIWGYDSQAEYNNTEVYVSFLRKKLHFIESRVKIIAVRGLGYRLEESHD